MLRRFRLRWQYAVVALLLAFLVCLPFDWFLPQYTTLMIFIGLSTMVTVGLCLLMGYTGQVSLGQAAFYGTGAYISAVLTKTCGVNPWLAMLVAAAGTGTFAFLIGYPIFRLKGNYLAIATLGLGLIVYVLFRQLGPGGPSGTGDIDILSIGGFGFDTPFRRYFLVWGFCLVLLLISQNIVNSRTGRALRAIHGSEEAASSLGVNVDRFKVKVFVLSAVYASLAGSLLVHHLRFVSPQPFDFIASVKLVVMAVIGGLASVWGAIFGAGTTRLLSDELLLRFGEWDVVVYGLVLMLVMILMPDGLFVWLKGAYASMRGVSRRDTTTWLKGVRRNLGVKMRRGRPRT